MPWIIRLVLFAALFLYSAAVPDVRGDELTGPPPPLPLAIGEHIAADIVDLIFLFDRVASDPPRAITPNYLTRVSDPSTAFYRDYLEYRQGKIDRFELANRLPHVAMMGDMSYAKFSLFFVGELLLAGKNAMAQELVPRY
jgi:hypothetical protein